MSLPQKSVLSLPRGKITIPPVPLTYSSSARLAETIGVTDAQLEFVKNSQSGTGLIKCGTTIVPFDNRISKDSKLYDLYNTNIHEKIRKGQMAGYVPAAQPKKPGSAVIKSTVTVKNGKKTKKYSYSTRVTVTGEEKREVSLADFVGEYRRVDFSDLMNLKPDLNDPTKSTLAASDDGYSFSSSLSMESGETVNIGPIQLKDSDMTYEKKFNESENQYEYILKYALSNGGNITFTKMGTGYWLAMEYKDGKYTYSEAHLRV